MCCVLLCRLLNCAVGSKYCLVAQKLNPTGYFFLYLLQPSTPVVQMEEEQPVLIKEAATLSQPVVEPSDDQAIKDVDADQDSDA